MTDQTLPRHRLLGELDEPGWRICVISAPSGYGKTTLLRSWADRAGAVVAWVSLGADSGSRDAFWQRVMSSARRLGQLTDEQLAAAVAASDDPIPAIARFLEGRGPVVVALDAYENVRGATAAVDNDLQRLVEQVRDVRVVITTRGPTDLTTTRALLRCPTRVISERALAFTDGETRTFLEPVLSKHPTTSVERIQADTLGYPLALRAIGIALERQVDLPRHDPAGWRGLVAEHLKDQLTDTPAHEFVLRTCIPPYVDVELADRLAGGGDTRQVLGDLEWNGFGRWLPYAPGRSVFQYVDSVRDVFLDDVRASRPSTFAELASVSAGWLHDNGEHELALALAIDAADFEQAADIFRAVLVSSPESYTTDRLGAQLRRVPSAVLLRSPVLAFAYGLALLSNVGTRAAAPTFLTTPAEHDVDAQPGLTSKERIFHHAVKAASLRFTSRYDESLEAAEEGIAQFHAMSADEQDALQELRPMALRHIAYSFFQAGRLAESRAITELAISTADGPWTRNYTLVYGVGLHAFDGRLPEARAISTLVDDDMWPRDHAHSYMNALGRVGTATLLLDDYEHEAALKQFEGCESFLETAEFWPLINWVGAHARLARGDAGSETQRLIDALADSPAPPGVGDNLGTAALLNVLAMSWFALGRPQEGRDVLRRRCSYGGQLAPATAMSRMAAGDPDLLLGELPALEARRGHTIRSMIATLTLAASAAVQVGSAGTATSLLRRSAALHAAHGPQAHLIYLSSGDMAALRDIAQASGDARLTAYLAGPVPSAIAGGMSVESSERLSRRELAVLRTMGEHATRSDMAAALHVSEHTVKSHLRSIYKKLGVNTRQAAIQRAIELDLFRERNT